MNDLLPDGALRLLRYLVMLDRAGVAPTVAEFDAFATTDPPQWRPYFVDTSMEDEFDITMAWSRYFEFVRWADTGLPTHPAISASRQKRQQWSDARDAAPLKITALGRAVLAGVESTDSGEDVQILLGNDEPMAYGIVLARIAARGTGMIVDAYLTDKVLLDLLNYTQINRVLTSTKGRGGTARAAAVAALAGANGIKPVAVRVTETLHDRFVIGDDGAVEALGTSLNSVHRNVTTFVPIDGDPARLIRGHYEELWSSAAPPTAAEAKDPARGSASRSAT